MKIEDDRARVKVSVSSVRRLCPKLEGWEEQTNAPLRGNIETASFPPRLVDRNGNRVEKGANILSSYQYRAANPYSSYVTRLYRILSCIYSSFTSDPT